MGAFFGLMSMVEQPEIPHLMIVMYLAYANGVILGFRRYQ